MDIDQKWDRDVAHMRIHGRIDAYWADHLTKAINSAISSGARHVTLNLSRVEYISSAGIRLLIAFHKQFRSKSGSLQVHHPSESVASVLNLTGLDEVLIAPGKGGPEPRAETTHLSWESDTCSFVVDDLDPESIFKCQMVGDPAKLTEGFEEADVHVMPFPESTFGIGLGALGSSFGECKDRVNEFMALAGAACYLPTDGSISPDLMVSEEALVPLMSVFYGISGQGEFARQFRFDAKPVAPGTLTFSEVVDRSLKAAGTDFGVIAMACDASCIVGEYLKKLESQETPGETLLTLAREAITDKLLCIAVGIASRKSAAPWNAMLEPLGAGMELFGHFHAALFSPQALPDGIVDMHAFVRKIFTDDQPQKLVHVVSSDGPSQTEFLRGICWVSAVEQPQPEKQTAKQRDAKRLTVRMMVRPQV
jgi:anti-anti-sigma factor